jgi:hypothetical protein
MTEVEFKIFKESKDFHLSVNKVVYSLLFLSLSVAYSGGKFLGNILVRDIGVAGCFLASILIFLFKIIQQFRRKALNGTLDDTLRLTESEILIDQQNYLLDEISKIEFNVGDYYNRWEYQSKGNLNPARTHGTDNTCKITLKSGEKIVVNFQLLFEYEFHRMKELLIHYHAENKIHFLKLIEYLEIDNYEDIQAFKKTLQSKSNLRIAT